MQAAGIKQHAAGPVNAVHRATQYQPSATNQYTMRGDSNIKVMTQIMPRQQITCQRVRHGSSDTLRETNMPLSSSSDDTCTLQNYLSVPVLTLKQKKKNRTPCHGSQSPVSESEWGEGGGVLSM